MPTKSELEAYLHSHIPMSAYMGCTVLEADFDRVVLGFPLEPNINHRQTVFGGSESAAAILSAWSVLWLRFREAGIQAKLVIRSNDMSYTQPALGAFVAATREISADDWEAMRNSLTRKGRGRITIAADILCDGSICGTMTGSFVALAADPTDTAPHDS